MLSENVSQQYGDHAMYFPREFVNPYYVASNTMCCDIPISSTNAINMCNLVP
jgi:hypothetical protein